MSDFMKKENLDKLHSIEVEILDEFVRICKKNQLEYFLIGGTLLGAVRHKGFIPWDDDLDVAMPRDDYEKFLNIAGEEMKSDFCIDNFNNNEWYYLNFTKIRKKDTLFVQDFQLEYEGPKGIWIDIFPLDNVKTEKNIFQDCRIKFIKHLRAIAHYKSEIFLSNKNLIVKKIVGFVFKPIPTNKLMQLADKLMKKDWKKNTKYFINISSQYNFHKQTMPKEKFLPAKQLEFEGKLYNVPNDYKYFLERIYGNYMELPPMEKRVTHNPSKLVFKI